MHYIQQVIRESEVDVVVNFYELLTGLTYLVYRPKAVLVCVAHQYLCPAIRLLYGCGSV